MDTKPLPIPKPTENWYDGQIGSTGQIMMADGKVRAVSRGGPGRITPEQRHSYAYWILCGAGGERNSDIPRLADWEPQALALYADHATAFDDEQLTMLMNVDFVDYWRASVGASDAAVDALAEHIREQPPETGANWGGMQPLKIARVELLLGCDTERALVHLGDLGRKNEFIRSVCFDRCVYVPDSGPAVRCYVSQPQMITKPRRSNRPSDPRLEIFPPIESVLDDPRGMRCAASLTSLLTINLSILPGDPLADSPLRYHHFLTSFCEECDEGGWDQTYEWTHLPSSDRRVQLVCERTDECEGLSTVEDLADEIQDMQTAGWRLDPLGELNPEYGYDLQDAGVIGGRPHWVQADPEVPTCCDRPMFFVGKIWAYDFGGTGTHLYGFHCELCGSGQQIVQIT